MTRLAYRGHPVRDKVKLELKADNIEEPGPLDAGWVLGEFKSGTVCSTDVTNLKGGLGHDVKEPVIIGHECCFRVIESRNDLIPVGAFIVPLGSDWFGFAEREKFLPVLPTTAPSTYDTYFSERGTYYDPDPQTKAVCVLDTWFSGASLIEPITHVFTALLRVGALDASSIVVLGAGFCGLIACHLAKLLGVHKISLVDINDGRLNLAREAGLADITLNPLNNSSAINELITETKGTFADVVFDALPGATLTTLPDGINTRDLGAQLLRPNGVWAMYSAAKEMQMPSLTLLAKGIRVFGAAYDSRLISFSKRAAQMKAVYKLVKANVIPVRQFISKAIAFKNSGAVKQAVKNYGRGPEVKIEIIRE
jgi:threonine dehydrogenase-like Zn-dependent dehydrogenase